MQLPADLQHAASNPTTDPAPNTLITTEIIAAPGPGRRLRIWHVGGGARLSSAPAHQLVLLFQTPTFVPRWGGMLATGGTTSMDIQIPGGMALPENTKLNLSQFANVASLPITTFAEYTIEAV